MHSIVGVFNERASAEVAVRLLEHTTYGIRYVELIGPFDPDTPTPPLLERGESMLRNGLRWGIWGALICEIPFILLFIFLAADNAVKIIILATSWKFGAAFGGWLGMMFGSERGLDQELAESYLNRLDQGKWIVSADTVESQQRHVRGAMLESGATEARDIRGTVEPRPNCHWLSRF